MPESINNDHDFIERQKYLLRSLERQSGRMTEHYRDHIKQKITLGELDEAHQLIREFRKFADDVFDSDSKSDAENFNSISLASKIKKQREMREANYAAHIKELEERNSILSSKLEQLSIDNEEKNKVFEGFTSRIKKLQGENNELRSQVQQQRIDEKIPTYVNNVKSDLGNDDKHFILMSIIWSVFGGVFGVLAVTSAFYTLYINLELKDLSNLQLIYIFTRGLIGIAILSWLSYICLSNSKKYTHESIRRKDRRHALMFGQVFLQIYGSTASKDDAIVVFKDWNMSGDSAFSDQTEQPPGLMSLWNSAKEKIKTSGDEKEVA